MGCISVSRPLEVMYMAGQLAAPATAPLSQVTHTTQLVLAESALRTNSPRCSRASPVGHACPTLTGVTKGASWTHCQCKPKSEE